MYRGVSHRNGDVGVLWLASQVLPLLPSCILAVAARLLLTGALHEDGLADFFDGFGGGHDQESRLRIMKDSPYRQLRRHRAYRLFHALCLSALFAPVRLPGSQHHCR